MQLVRIRYAQIKRAFMPPLLIYISVCLFLFYYAPKFDTSRSAMFVSGALIILYQYHVKRNDIDFLKRYIHDWKWQMLVLYNITALPLSLGLVFVCDIYYPVLLQVLVSCIPFIGLKTSRKTLIFLGRIFPSDQFEWISGTRRNFILLLILSILAILLSPVKLFPLVILLLLNLSIIDFYSLYEPLIMLNPNGYSIERFLSHKLNFGIKLFLLINLPILITNSLFNHDMFTFNIFFLVSTLILFANAVMIKYATYIPNESLTFHADMLLLTFSVIIPFFIPLSLFLLYQNHKKAKQNLLRYTT